MQSRPIVVVMGVTGVGKTTIGSQVAARLGVPFVDADDFHDPKDIARMHRGEALDDAARAPWLDRLNAELQRRAAGGIVLACSALKRSYRERLVRGLPAVRFVLLTTDPGVIEERIGDRVGHFAGAALLPSQLETLECPDDAVVVDATGSPAAVSEAVLHGLEALP